MRRPWGEALLSIGTVAVILLVLVAVDDRVRDQFSMRFMSSRPSVEIAAAGQHARDLTSVIAEAARDQSLAHAPLLIFALAAVVLVLFMLRT
jgi:hypothetical protein